MIETVSQLSAACEFKLAKGDSAQAMTFSGHGAIFGNVDAYGDVIEPGAFSAWLADVKAGRQPWPAMLSQHGGWGMSADDLTPVGVYVDLAEDGKGLAFDGKLADTPRGRELHALMKMDPRPAISGVSIGYIAKEWEPRSKPDDPRRRLKRIDVMEISLVTFPANPKARVGAVKFGAGVRPANIRDFEAALRELGLSQREAMRAASAAWPALQPDASEELSEIATLLSVAANSINGLKPILKR